MIFLLKMFLPRLIIVGIVVALAIGVYIYSIRNKEKMNNGSEISKKDYQEYLRQNMQLFTKEDCTYCKQMVNQLSKMDLLSNTQIINVDTPDGKKLFEQTGEIGVPCLRSGLTEKVKCGYTDNIKEILTELA